MSSYTTGPEGGHSPLIILFLSVLFLCPRLLPLSIGGTAIPRTSIVAPDLPTGAVRAAANESLLHVQHSSENLNPHNHLMGQVLLAPFYGCDYQVTKRIRCEPSFDSLPFLAQHSVMYLEIPEGRQAGQVCGRLGRKAGMGGLSVHQDKLVTGPSPLNHHFSTHPEKAAGETRSAFLTPLPT